MLCKDFEHCFFCKYTQIVESNVSFRYVYVIIWCVLLNICSRVKFSKLFQYGIQHVIYL